MGYERVIIIIAIASTITSILFVKVVLFNVVASDSQFFPKKPDSLWCLFKIILKSSISRCLYVTGCASYF